MLASLDAWAAARHAEHCIEKAKINQVVGKSKFRLHMKYIRAKRTVRNNLIHKVQSRVLELIGDKAQLISVDLIEQKVILNEQLQFEPGTATIKPICDELVSQIQVSLRAINIACNEFAFDKMQFKVEGHTAPSKKSTDGGIGTSQGRALEVCRRVGADPDIDGQMLHPVGYGCTRPPKDRSDPRRVEIHVLDKKSLEALLQNGEELKQPGA